MGSSILQIALYALSGGVFGALIGWSVHTASSKRRLNHLTSQARMRLDEIAGQRDKYANECSRSRAKIEQLQAANATRSAELKSLFKKSKLLAKGVRTLKRERENTKIKLGTIQNAFASLRQQTKALQSEFDKTREFYRRELTKSLGKRKELEEEIQKARAEQEAFARRVEASVLEHGSEEDMVVAAQLRLGQLDVLERNINKLETENAQLRQDATQLKREFAAREKDLAELEELRVHNKQLLRGVEALEDSRKEHEADAEKYREQADESEKLSDTLRLKLEDLEKNFAEMERQQSEALDDARKASVVPILRKQG